MPRVAPTSLAAAIAIVSSSTSSESVSSVCPAGFFEHGQGCYFLSEDEGNFTQCQHQICGAGNSSLAVVRDAAVVDFLATLAATAGVAHAYIGLYSRPDGKGVSSWDWVDGSGGSGFDAWAAGEPNNWCLDEDCVLLGWGASRGWASVACGARFRCFCRFGGYESPRFRAAEASLGATDGEPNYEQCFRRRARCWWFGHGGRSFQVAFLSLFLPCLAAMLWAAAEACGLTPRSQARVVQDLKARAEECDSASCYGQLLDPAESGSEAAADGLVDRWVIRGAWGAILYSVALFTLAFTTLLHINYGVSFGFSLDALEAFVMFVCKLAVGLSAHAVHRHLSPVARTVASGWVLVLAASKLLMALCALVLSGMYASIALGGTVRESSSFCKAWYVFCWTLLLSLVSQCAGGVALARIHARAVCFLGDSQVFSRVVGGSWPLLTGGTFGVGLGLGLCSALVVFDDPGDGYEPVQAIGLCYLAAACCQFLAGAAMLRANAQIRAHFAAAVAMAKQARGACASVSVRDVVRAAELAEVSSGAAFGLRLPGCGDVSCGASAEMYVLS